jgi:hypothetical protein
MMLSSSPVFILLASDSSSPPADAMLGNARWTSHNKARENLQKFAALESFGYV